MPKRSLHVVQQAYRATLEEQDDPVVWLCHALRDAGSDLDLLLQGNAVVYGVRSQHVDPLCFGERCQRNAPDLTGDLGKLMAKGVECFYVEEDAAARGLHPSELLDGLVPLRRGKLAELFSRYHQVHGW